MARLLVGVFIAVALLASAHGAAHHTMMVDDVPSARFVSAMPAHHGMDHSAMASAEQSDHEMPQQHDDTSLSCCGTYAGCGAYDHVVAPAIISGVRYESVWLPPATDVVLAGVNPEQIPKPPRQ